MTDSSTLLVIPEELTQTGKVFGDKSVELLELVSSLGTQVDIFRDSIPDPAKPAFDGLWLAWQRELTQLAYAIEAMGMNLQNSATAYYNTDVLGAAGYHPPTDKAGMQKLDTMFQENHGFFAQYDSKFKTLYTSETKETITLMSDLVIDTNNKQLEETLALKNLEDADAPKGGGVGGGGGNPGHVFKNIN
jgi:uncharacterized protein YukE